MKPCCEDLTNREIGFGPREGFLVENFDLVVTHCTVCDCRHIEVAVDPLELNLTGTSLA